MKRVHLLLLVMGMIFLACEDKKNSPDYVAVQFLTAMENENFEEARKYADSTTIKMVNMMQSLAEMDKKNAGNKEKKKSNVTFNVEKVEKKDENTAIVYYKSTNNKETQQKIDVVKINGK